MIFFFLKSRSLYIGHSWFTYLTRIYIHVDCTISDKTLDNFLFTKFLFICAGKTFCFQCRAKTWQGVDMFHGEKRFTLFCSTAGNINTYWLFVSLNFFGPARFYIQNGSFLSAVEIFIEFALLWQYGQNSMLWAESN